MSVQIPIRSIALAAPLLVWGASFGVPAQAAPANDCLAAPNAPAQKGQHWYYHTDRKKGRKCWFLRDVNQPHQSAMTGNKSAAAPAPKSKKPAVAPAGAAKSTSAAHRASSPSTKAEPAPKPAPAHSATASEPIQQDVQTKRTAPTFPDPPTAYTSEPSQPAAPAATAAPTVPIIWPDLRPVETIKIRKPNSGPGDAAAQAVPPTRAVRTQPAPNDTARSAAPAKSAQAADVTVSPGMTPVQMALVVLSALTVAGLLYYLVIRIAASRRRRDVLNYTPPVWVDDPHRRPWRNEPRPQAHLQERKQPVTAQEQFVDGSHVSLVPAASGEGVRRAPRPTDTHRMYAPRKATAVRTTGVISEHENNLAQLIRDLDQLLQTRKQA